MEKRLEGTWQIVEYTSDGVDSLKNFNDSCNCVMRILIPYDNENGKKIFFSDTNYYAKFGGKFTFSKNKKYINSNFENTSYKSLGPIGGGKNVWKILKLTKKELKISTSYYGRNYYISFNKISDYFN